MRRLHTQIAGDGSAVSEDVQALRRHLLEALRQHTAAERDLLHRLREQLSTSQWSELTEQYAQRLQRGPTRPHPHTPRNGAAGQLAYRLSAFASHVLDVLDSRPVRAVPAMTTRAAA